MAELNLIQELELAVSHGEDDRRAAALVYVTDLLINGRYQDDDVWMFGEIIGQLASEIEIAARAQLAARIAPCTHAPSNVIDRFACDGSIDVARPILRQSERISPDALLQVARTKGQDHLLAISQRPSLNEDVTDVLVTRGNREVLHAVAKNIGARFSESGFWKLVQRSENDIVLTLAVGGRRDIPRHHFQKLIAKASDEAKSKLAALNPSAADHVCNAVADVTGSIHERFGPATRSYYAAKRQIGEMHRAGQLTEQVLCELARARKHEEVTVALTLLCELPVNVVERALHDEQGEMVLILAKAAKLSWVAARLLLLMDGKGISPHDLEAAANNYSLLNVATARQVTNFYRARQEAAGAGRR